MMNLNVNMDTVINKLRSTVSTVTSTVSQLSVVLPGNPVTREFEVTQHVASGGPGLMWKIYSGFKKTTKQEAAVFVFEKKQLDKWSRKDRDSMIESMKKGVNQLTRLKHPRILTVQHPLEESRDSLAFATEPVFASLANVLGDYNNMPDPIDQSFREYKLHEIEIKYGLLQICDGMTFLHNDAKILHGNICPESIIVNKQNSWKIFGFDFCISASVNGSEVTWPSKTYDMDAQPLTQQCLDYLAPEYTSSMTCSPSSDMFALGMLTYTSFNGGKPVFANRGDWNRHRQNIIVYNQLPESKLTDIPTELRNFCRRLLSFNGTERPDSHEFSKYEFFHDEGVKTLTYLDSLFQWDNLQKSKFYKGLSEILPGLPHRVRLLRVVPCLSQEFVNPTMVPFVLPNVLKIAEWSTAEEYVLHVLPYLKEVMKLREPVQVLFIFMKNMELLLQKTPPDITKSDVLPLIYGSLESDSPQVQELCLSIIPSFAGLIDYPAMKNSLLPRIRKLVVTTSSLSVRVNCLVCIGKILDHLDKWMVMDFILPFLTEIPSRDPAVVMGIVGIYRLAVNHRKLGVTKEIIATKILPFIFPLCVENGLTTQQFTTIMNFVYEMIKLVETEHKMKLEELGAIANEREKMKVEMNSSGDSTENGIKSSMDFFNEFNSNTKAKVTPAMPKYFDRGDMNGSSYLSETPPNPLSASSEPRPMKEKNHNHPTRSNVAPQRNVLMSSLLSSNLKQMGGPVPSPIRMGMPTSASMPLVSNNTLPNGNCALPMSPSVAFGIISPFSQPPKPMGYSGFQPRGLMAASTPMSFPAPTTTNPVSNLSNNPSYAALRTGGSSLSSRDATVKTLSRSEIDDFLN